MVMLRPLSWPDDREPLLALDTSFVTDRVYRLEQTDRSFTLTEVPAAPPVRKTYPFAHEVNSLSMFEWVQVASSDGAVVGVAAMKIEGWNKRAVLHHLYVAPTGRGRGVGRAMFEAAMGEARRRNARCLWAETQTTNYGAIRFYERTGFAWCGLDKSLYDPGDTGTGEIALFFSRPVE